jgi:hypothetical protein
VREEGATVSRAAADFGFSRPAFYQAQTAFEAEGLPGVASDLIPPRSGSGEPCGPPAASRCSAALRAPSRGDPPHDARFARRLT